MDIHHSFMPSPRDTPPSAAIAAIRAILNPSVTPSLNPSVPHSRHASSYAERASIQCYTDPDGYEFWFDYERLVLVRAARQGEDTAAHPPRPDVRLPVAELRGRAIDLIERQIPGFRRDMTSYHPYEGNRKKCDYRFRWESHALPLAESDVTPYVEVTLRADGELVEYVNALR